MKSIKTRVTQWISERIQDSYIDSKTKPLKNQYFHFVIEGFCDEPSIFLVATTEGLEWGYDATVWDHPATPSIKWKIKRRLSWGGSEFHA